MTTRAAVKQRLTKCSLEIQGVKKAWDNPPSEMIVSELLPCAYTLSGPMVAPAPATSAGQAQKTIAYIVRVLVSPVVLGMDTGKVGAPGYDLVDTYKDRFEAYYFEHPHLSTNGTNETALGDLALVRDLALQTGVTEPKEAPGGNQCWGFDITLTITTRVITTRTS